MWLRNEDGVVAKLVAWNLSQDDFSYALVMLDDGKLEEWRIDGCFVVERHKTQDNEIG